MTKEDFYIAALSILGARGELAGRELCIAINDRIGISRVARLFGRGVGFGTFYIRMGELEEQGCVTHEDRPDDNRLVRYYKITDGGKRRRCELLESHIGKKGASGEGLPAPQPS